MAHRLYWSKEYEGKEYEGKSGGIENNRRDRWEP
jgi:hypothetical protein